MATLRFQKFGFPFTFSLPVLEKRQKMQGPFKVTTTLTDGNDKVITHVEQYMETIEDVVMLEDALSETYKHLRHAKMSTSTSKSNKLRTE